MKDYDNTLRSIYTTLFSQKYSRDGNELAVCSNFGEIALYNLPSLLSVESIDKPKVPYFKFKAHQSCLYSLESTNDYLICGGLNEITGWRWKDLTTKNCLKTWSVRLPSEIGDINNATEINYLIYDSKNEPKCLYAACGNGEIYCIDLECCKIIRKIPAHKECIYQIILKNNSTELFSASEDGDVKLWDLRTSACEMTIKPFENEICARPHYGRHINCIAIDDDNWMICGGGPKLTMWHLRSMKPMNVIDLDSTFIPNACIIFENQVITGGNKTVYIVILTTIN